MKTASAQAADLLDTWIRDGRFAEQVSAMEVRVRQAGSEHAKLIDTAGCQAASDYLEDTHDFKRRHRVARGILNVVAGMADLLKSGYCPRHGSIVSIVGGLDKLDDAILGQLSSDARLISMVNPWVDHLSVEGYDEFNPRNGLLGLRRVLLVTDPDGSDNNGLCVILKGREKTDRDETFVAVRLTVAGDVAVRKYSQAFNADDVVDTVFGLWPGDYIWGFHEASGLVGVSDDRKIGFPDATGYIISHLDALGDYYSALSLRS